MSRSSAAKRRFEDALQEREAVIEARLRKEFEQMYAVRLSDEVKRRKAAEKKAEAAVNKCSARSREVTMWRIRAHRAARCMRNLFIQQDDGTRLRTQRVRVQVGGMRRAIKKQLVEESGALQPRRCGLGGTEFTTRELLLSFQTDSELGIGSRHDRSERSNNDRARRQHTVSVALFARKGRKSRRHDETVPVNVFVQPGEKVMKGIRFAMHMLACYKWRSTSRDALAINVSPDCKTFGPFPTLGAHIDCITSKPDTDNVDAFNNSPDAIEVWPLRPPIMQIPSKAVVEQSLRRRKDGGAYLPQTSLKLTTMLIACGVLDGMDENRSAVRFACDAAADNKGGGKQKETMDNMSGENSIIDRLMYSYDARSEAAANLESMGLLQPIQQYFSAESREDLERLLASLTKERLELDRVERTEAAARGAAKRALKNLADSAASDADEATARVAKLAREVDQIKDDIRRVNELKELLKAAEKEEKEKKEAARVAKRRVKEAAKQRNIAGAGAEPAADAPTAAASSVPAATAPRLQRGPLKMSGPVPKCREEQERLFRLTMYEARLRPVLKRQRFWRWILHLWRYKTQKQCLIRDLNDTSSHSGRQER